MATSMTTDPVRPTPGVVDAVRLLQQVRARRRANKWNHHGLRSARRLVLFGTVVVPSVIFAFLGFTLLLAINFGKCDTRAEAETLLATLLMVAFATALAGSLSTALQSLFASDDVRFLVSLPIPVRAIFFDRIGEIARGAVPSALFGMATCLAFVLGRAEDYRFVAYGLLAVSLLCATAVIMGASTTAITVRYANPSQSRRILIGLSLVLIMLAAVVWRLVTSRDGMVDPPTVVRVLLWILPSGWARSALVRSVGSDPQTALPLVALQVAALGGLLVVGARVFASTYTSNIERTEIASIRPTVRRSSPVGRRILRLVPRTSVHWVKREWFLLSRDFSRMSAAILPVGSVAVWVALSFVWGATAGHSTGDQFWLSHLPVLILPWGISLGTTVFAIGAENKGIELIRVLPISAGALMRAKYFAYVIPILLVSESVAVISIAAKPGSTEDAWLLVLQTAILSALFCAVDISFAAAAPRFDRDHAQRSTGFFARLASATLGLMLAGTAIVGLANTSIGDPDLIPTVSGDGMDQSRVIAALALSLAIGLPILLLRFGRKRLTRTLNNR
jgi:hypothetical protein